MFDFKSFKFNAGVVDDDDDVCCCYYYSGVILLPHCRDGMWEVLADQESYFTCTAEGPVYWTLRSNDDSTISIALCDKHCTLYNGYDGLFSANTIDLHKSTVIINAKNNSRVYDNVQLVNGSLECSRWDQDTTTAACGLNFVCKYIVSLRRVVYSRVQ